MSVPLAPEPRVVPEAHLECEWCTNEATFWLADGTGACDGHFFSLESEARQRALGLPARGYKLCRITPAGRSPKGSTDSAS